MNAFTLSGVVKATDEISLTLDVDGMAFKIALSEGFNLKGVNIQAGDKIILTGKLEASKGIKLVANKCLGITRSSK